MTGEFGVVTAPPPTGRFARGSYSDSGRFWSRSEQPPPQPGGWGRGGRRDAPTTSLSSPILLLLLPHLLLHLLGQRRPLELDLELVQLAREGVRHLIVLGLDRGPRVEADVESL